MLGLLGTSALFTTSPQIRCRERIVAKKRGEDLLGAEQDAAGDVH